MKSKHQFCYECRWRGALKGSAHSKCCHPYNKDIIGDPLINLTGLFASVGRVAMSPIIDERLKIKANQFGMMWFHYPVNYDPYWLESCAGFEEFRENDARKLNTSYSDGSGTCEQPYVCENCPKRFECFTNRES